MAKLTKKCSVCHKEKSWDNFYMRSDRPRPKARCKVCEIAAQKKYYSENKTQIQIKKRKYARKHQKERKAYEKEWRKRPESKIKRLKQNSVRRQKNKQKAVDYKGGKCSCCGYNKCLAALEFHHIDPCKKEGETSKLKTGKWVVFKKELDKCILLCSNCHRELHNDLSVFEVCNE
jgi:hypothetical protein